MGTLNKETAIGYARVSTVDQSEGYSVAAQRNRIEAYALSRGWVLADVCIDDGYTTRKRRPAFDAMLERVASEGINHVVVVRLDRAGRSALDLLRLYEALEALGTSLVSIEEGIDTSTPVGRFLRTILAAVAELERDMVSERTRAAMAEAKRQGVRMGRPLIVSDETTAAILALRRAKTSYPKIIKALEAGGVAPLAGKAWYPSTVQRICRRHGL